MANEILGARSYLNIAAESAWGTVNETPAWVYVPVTDFSVRARPQRRNSTPFTGLRQRKHGRAYRVQTSGGLAAELYGWVDETVSVAQHLIDWGFGSHESVDLPSKSARWAEGPGVANQEYRGLTVNSATIQGDEGSGVVTINLDLMGKDEAVASSVPALGTDHEKLTEFLFSDVTFELGETPISIQNFSWQVQNNLQAVYNNSLVPSFIKAGDRVETLSVSLIKNSATYDAYRRLSGMTEFSGELVMKGLHNGTGTSETDYTVVTVTFGRLQFADADDQRQRGLMPTTLTFDVLKPDDNTNGSVIAYTEE